MAAITPALITALRTGFQKNFQDAITDTPTNYAKIATVVPSSSASNTYGWLGQFPTLTEWIGPRVAKNLSAQAYQVLNKLYESTVAVKRTDIEDDNVGIYSPLFAEMGRAAATHPDQLVHQLLAQGHLTNCYDGQFFFDVDHPVFPNADGTGVAVSNINNDVPVAPAVAGPAWYLLDAGRALKPLIFQERTKPELLSMVTATDEGVFSLDEYRYGLRYRCNAGFGFWQMANRSQYPLDVANFNAVMSKMMSLTADGGRPLGIQPTTLVVPPSLRAAAIEIVKSERLASGASNPNFGVVELIVSPWLA